MVCSSCESCRLIPLIAVSVLCSSCSVDACSCVISGLGAGGTGCAGVLPLSTVTFGLVLCAVSVPPFSAGCCGEGFLIGLRRTVVLPVDSFSPFDFAISGEAEGCGVGWGGTCVWASGLGVGVGAAAGGCCCGITSTGFFRAQPETSTAMMMASRIGIVRSGVMLC